MTFLSNTTILRRSPARSLVGAVLLAGALAGCSGGGVDRDASGAVTSSGSVSAFELRVGDCSNPDLGETVRDLGVVPCADSHTHEVFHLAEHPDVPYPGSAALEVFAEQQCVGAFGDYVGVELTESSLYFTYLYPSVGTWNDDEDREVVCFVVSREEPLTGSVRGSGR